MQGKLYRKVVDKAIVWIPDPEKQSVCHKCGSGSPKTYDFGFELHQRSVMQIANIHKCWLVEHCVPVAESGLDDGEKRRLSDLRCKIT